MADYYLDINGISKHLNTDVEYNEKNPGFGMTVEAVDDYLVKMLTTGGYKNSFGNPSYYAGGGLAKRFGNDYYADIGAVGGVMTGYEESLSPMAALYGAVGKKDLAKLRMMYAPETEKSPSLIMMNLGIPFK